MRLEIPSEMFGASYRSLVREFVAAGEPFVPFILKYPTDDFPAFLRQLEGFAAGSELPGGFVAHETFWLIDATDQVVGVSNLRLTLNDRLRREGGHIGYGIRPSARRKGYATRILGETLLVARQRGIARALLTCDKGNVGSLKAILANGGVFDSEELLPGQDHIKQRYWISLVQAEA